MDTDADVVEVSTFSFDFADNAQTVANQPAVGTTGNNYVVAIGGEFPSKSNNESAEKMTSSVSTIELETRLDHLMHQNSGGLHKLPPGISESLLGPFRQVSILLIMAIVVLSAAVITAALMPEIIDVTQQAARIFYATLYGLSIICLVVLLVFGIRDRLTVLHERHRDHGAYTFYKVGAVGLGTGSIIYETINIVVNSTAEGDCVAGIIQSSLAITFTLLEITLFLKYSKVVINKSAVLSIMSLFMVAQLTSNNIAVWLYAVVIETVEGSNYTSSSTGGSTGGHSSTGSADSSSGSSGSTGSTSNCDMHSSLRELIIPYLFPMTVEYSVIAMVITLTMWEKCGWREPDFYIAPNRRPVDTASTLTAKTDDEVSNDSRRSVKMFTNSHIGFVLGWVILIGSVVIIIVYLYYMYTGVNGHAGVMDTVAYGWDIAIKSLCLLGLVVCFVRMSTLTTKGPELILARRHRDNRPMPLANSTKINRQLDEQLTNITFFALLVYQVFELIAAVESRNNIIIADVVLTICSAAVQMVFVVSFAGHRRTTTDVQRATRPGRQCLEMLRIANFALWGLGTFIFKHSTLEDTIFGSGSASNIISNITHPLQILFYFHSVGCLTEVIHHSYTAKYVGLMAPKSTVGIVARSSVAAGEVPDAFLLVRSTSVANFAGQQSKSPSLYGHGNGKLSRMPSVSSKASQ